MPLLPVLIQALLLATSGLLSVGSITLVILLLLSDRGWHNGLGYALGYTSAYTLIGIGAVLLGYRANGDASGERGLVLPLLVLLLGTLLWWLAWRNWRKPVSEAAAEPRFFAIVDRITPPRAFGFGALVSVINFKNLTLFLTAMSVVILSSLPLGERIAIALLVTVVFCLAVIIPVLIFLLFPRRAAALLTAFRQFLGRHSRPIGVWAPLLFGLLLIIKGVTDLL